MYSFVNKLKGLPTAFSITKAAKPAPMLEYEKNVPGFFFKKYFFLYHSPYLEGSIILEVCVAKCLIVIAVFGNFGFITSKGK